MKFRELVQGISNIEIDKLSEQEIAKLSNSITEVQDKLLKKINHDNETTLFSSFQIIESHQIDKLIHSIINVAQGKLSERIAVGNYGDTVNSLSASINMLFEELEWKTNILIENKEELEKQHHFVRNITDAISDILYILDINTYEIAYTNKEVFEMLGYNQNDIIGKKSTELMSLIHPDDIERTNTDLGSYKLLKKGEKVESEFRLKHKNGSWIWASRKTTPFSFDKNGKVKEVLGTIADITNRKESEILIRENEEKYRTLSETSADAIIISNSNEEIVSWSKGAENIFGYKLDEILGQKIKLIVPDKYLKKHSDAFNKRQKAKKSTNSVLGKTRELEGIKKNGDIFPIEINISAWSVNNVQYFSAIIRDITERKEMQNQMNEREIRLRKAQKMAKLGYWNWDIANNQIEWSEEAYNIFGKPKKEKINYQNFLKKIHPDDRKKVDKAVKSSLENLQGYEIEHRIITDDGLVKNVLETGELIIENNKAVKMTGTVQDITQRVQLSLQVKESEDRLKEAQRIAKIGHWDWGIKNETLTWSDEAYNIYGFDKKTTTPSYDVFINLIHPEDREYIAEAINLAMTKVKDYKVDHKIVLQDGTLKYVEEVGVIHFENEQPVRMIGTVQDITERVELSLLVKDSEERLREAQRITQLGHWDWKIKEGSLHWSDEIYNIFGVNKDTFEASYDSFIEFIHPEDRDKVNEGVDLALRKIKTYEVDHRLVLRDGTLKHVQEIGFVHFNNGVAERMIGTVLDITNRKKSEIQLTKSLEEKDVLLKEIHHRVKNNLQIVDGLLSLQLRKTKDIGAQMVLKDSKSRIKTIALVHEQLYQQDNLGEINFSLYLQNLIKNIKNTVVDSTKFIAIVFDTDPIKIKIDKAIPLGLIANELIINAYKHAFNEVDSGEIKMIFKPSRDECMLSVQDNGIGFPDNFETKQKDSLGYKIINSLVGQLDARIEFSSEGEGACTSVFLNVN